jgi:small-conductance mechanosensitive channel
MSVASTKVRTASLQASTPANQIFRTRCMATPRSFASAAVLLATMGLAIVSTAPAQVKTAAAKTPDASSLQAADGAAPGQPTAPSAETAVKLAALPTPFPPGLIQGIAVPSQSQAIRSHLNEVIRYYRMAVTQVQKVGEPSDTLYAQQVQSEATQAGQLAFKAARGQAEFIQRIPVAGSTPTLPEEASKVTNRIQTIAKQIVDLQQQEDALDQQSRKTPASKQGDLNDQKNDIQGQLKLYTAILSALQKVVSPASGEASGLSGDIDRLQHSVPELVDSKYKPVSGTIETLGTVREAGVSSQATMLFQLLSTQRAIEERIAELKLLHTQAEALRQPLGKVLLATFAAAEDLKRDTGSTSTDLRAKAKKYDDLTRAFTTLSDVAVPLSQEVLLLEQAQNTLISWRASVSSEQSSLLHALLLRIISIAVALIIIFAIGAAWRTAVNRYVQDVRRRRQILLVRRLIVGFLSGLVLIFGFVTQFSSLATFAGFITAGIAVGLQTLLLSVAAYFFIVGRYGIKVGDRITVAGVTGEVVEVGLVRFYLIELTGSGTELHSTGRVAVFANSVLFQAGTPLYKQLPGTGFAWHELTLKIRPESDYRPALDIIRQVVESVYSGYKEALARQHHEVETWIDTAIEQPHVEARLQLTDGAQFAVLYPVQIKDAAETDQKIVEQILDVLARNTTVSSVVDGIPTVRAIVKS